MPVFLNDYTYVSIFLSFLFGYFSFTNGLYSTSWHLQVFLLYAFFNETVYQKDTSLWSNRNSISFNSIYLLFLSGNIKVGLTIWTTSFNFFSVLFDLLLPSIVYNCIIILLIGRLSHFFNKSFKKLLFSFH